jgi:hypothetical protein
MKHLRRWGAVYVLLVLFVGSWLGQFLAQLNVVRQEQSVHHQPFMVSDFVVQFVASTLENWQSEWLQLIFQAILLLGAKHWIFRVDAEDLERVERKIDAIRADLESGRDGSME